MEVGTRSSRFLSYESLKGKLGRNTLNWFKKNFHPELINQILVKKLSGLGFEVRIDETMMNYKCKSQRGQSPKNKRGALCII